MGALSFVLMSSLQMKLALIIILVEVNIYLNVSLICITQGSKSLQGTNTLAYLAHSEVEKKKKYLRIFPIFLNLIISHSGKQL